MRRTPASAGLAHAPVARRVGRYCAMAVARTATLLAFLFISVTTQMLWICFAPVSHDAERFYGVSELHIGALAMLYMVVYVPASLPASWALDRFGFRKAVSFGAVLLGVCGVARACVVSYAAVVVCSVGLALSQPLLLNAFTKLAALWFAPRHRATITGLAFLAMFVGVAVGQAVTPLLVATRGIDGMQQIYAVVTAVSAVAFVVFARDPAGAADDERALVLTGLSQMLRRRDVWLLCVALFVGNGVMNGLSTWVVGVVAEAGVDVRSAGDLAALMLVGGVVGAVALPLVSDQLQRRKIVVLAAFALATPAMAAVPLAASSGAPSTALAAAFFCLGLFTTGAAPVAYQYGAELTAPVPAGTSNGVFALVGQASVVVIFAMGASKDALGRWAPSLWACAGAVAACVAVCALLSESPIARRS